MEKHGTSTQVRLGCCCVDCCALRERQREGVWISVTECQPRQLYRVAARNFRFGVFKPDCSTDGFSAGFIGIRSKFSRRFLDVEYHWDQGPPYGTAKPVEDLGVSVPVEIPLDIRSPELFAWLENQNKGL